MTYQNDDGSITSNAAPRTLADQVAITAVMRARIAALEAENARMKMALINAALPPTPEQQT